MRLPRRLALPTLLPLLGLLPLVACSSDPDAPDSPLAAVEAAASRAASGAAAGGSRTVTDAKGRSVEVPAVPERVVALSEPTLDAALALGVTPVGTTNGRGQSTVSNYLLEQAADVPVVAEIGQPRFEQVAAADPDLILVDGTTLSDDAVIDKLDAIAPTVWVNGPGEDWKVAFEAAADALGKQAEAEEVLAEHDARVEEVKASLGENADAQVSIVRWTGGLPALLLQEINSSRVVAEVGLTRPPAQDKEGPGHSSPVSLENLDQVDAEWLFLGTLGGAAGPGGGGGAAGSIEGGAGGDAAAAALQLAQDVPGFSDLSVAKSGNIVLVDGSAWTSAGGPLAAGVVLDEVQAALGS